MSKLKSLAGHTVIYGASSILGRLLNYILVPLHTGIFTAAEYGSITNLYAYTAVFLIIYLCGMETAYFRFGTKHKESENKYFSASFFVVLLVSTVISGTIILFSNQIASAAHYPHLAHCVRWLAMLMFADAIVAIPFAKLRLENKALRFAITKLLNIGLTLLLNIWFYTLNDPENGVFTNFYEGELIVSFVFLANLISNSLLVVLVADVFFKINLNFRQEHIRTLLGYSWPLVFMGLGGMTNEMFSRVILEFLLSDDLYTGYNAQEALGIFGACYKLTVFMALATQAYRYAAEPFFFSSAADKTSPEFFAQSTHWFIVLGCLTCFGVSANLNLIAPLVLKKDIFLEGLDVVPILLMGSLMLGVYFNLSIWYKIKEKTVIGMYISLTGAVLTIVGNVIMVPILGYHGSAAVTLFTYCFMVAVSYIIGQRQYPIPYMLIDLVYLVATAVISYLIYSVFNPDMIQGIVFSFLGVIFVLFVERKRLPSKK